MTTSIQRILVATDFSDEADAAVCVAVECARRFGARIHLFHVFSMGEVEVARLLADTAALAGSDVPVTIASARGAAAEEILHYAGRNAIDLIVMGTHGRSGLSRVLLGSVADRVLRGGVCPVLAVPPRAVVLPAQAPPAAGVEVAKTPVVERPCLVCATPSRDLVCAPCRARIRGEALEHKHREERGGRA